MYWDPHLGNSKRFILKEVKKSPYKKKLNIIGAGILLDIPLQELSQMFEQVTLIDILFLPRIKKYVKQFSNVKLLELDITGHVDDVFQNKDKVLSFPPALPPADVTVSANLLSQLPLLLMDYLETEDQEWGKRIIEQHLELIQTCSPMGILICETNQIYYDKLGQIIEDNDMMLGATLPEPQDKWTWQIAPRGEASGAYSIEGTVKAFVFNQIV